MYIYIYIYIYSRNEDKENLNYLVLRVSYYRSPTKFNYKTRNCKTRPVQWHH